ncbi:MAG: DUF6088 family protein [Burkholderiaceae bacterium]
MSILVNTILQIAHTQPEGSLISPKDFLYLGTRAAVDQTLARLAKQGKLLRVSRGNILRPYYWPF